jgi:CBS domain containing-hemolysin-like protein
MTPHPYSIDLVGVLWRLGATLFFVFLNGFFVAAEFAMVRVRTSRVEQLARSGRSSARVAQHIQAHLDLYLSACQLGITLASLILGALGQPVVSVLLIGSVELLGLDVSAGAPWVSFVSLAIAFTAITVLHITLGEQAPKMLALRRAEGIALGTARAMRAFTWVFGPFISVINGVSNGILHWLGLHAEPGGDGIHSAEEIRSILSLSARSGTISEREYEITENVFHMIKLEVRHIMVPRVDVDFLSEQWDDEDNLSRIRESGHSRLPLCELGLDTIVGFVHTKDVLDTVLQGARPDLRALAREPVFVPDTMSVSDFLLEVQAKKVHCAAVLDEHGTAVGLAFREDALEEVVGPLGDEFDEKEADFQVAEDGSFEVRGRMSLPDLCDRLDFELADDEYEDEDTIGGHVTARLGRLPRKGDVVTVGPFRATVLDAGRRRVQRLRLERLPEEPSEEREAG